MYKHETIQTIKDTITRSKEFTNMFPVIKKWKIKQKKKYLKRFVMILISKFLVFVYSDTVADILMTNR